MTARRHFADTFSLNQLAVVDPDADHALWGRRLAASGPMRLEAGKGSAYSVPTFNAADATTTVRVFQRRPYRGQNLLDGGKGYGATIPWNPAWLRQLPTGNDATVVIVDEKSGDVIELWIAGKDTWDNAFVFENLTAGWGTLPASRKLAVADMRRWSSIWTRTDDPGHVGIRGCGLDKPACIVRLEELEAGRIDHAINMTISNTGPGFRAPATRSEWAVGKAAGLDIGNGTPSPTSMLLPSGTRFVLDWDAFFANSAIPMPLDGSIDWTLMRTFRNYGIVATETGGYGTGIETDYRPDQAARWAALGITSADATQPHQRFLAALSQAPVWKLAKPSGGVV
mgnify:CR=1 FL=1